MCDTQPYANIDFQAMLEAAPDAVVVHDLDDCVLYWNRAAELLYGWSLEEIQGCSISRILYCDCQQREEAMEVLNRKNVWQGELRQIDRNGDEHLVQVRQQMQRKLDGSARAVISFNTDVTDLRKIADAKARARHVKSSSILVGGVAHELNNVLAPIMLSSALLQRSVEDEKAQNMLSMIEKSATTGAELIARLLAFERGKSGGNDLIQVTQLKRAILRANENLVPNNVKAKIDIAPDLWSFRGDLSGISRAFEHVIQNACEAMPEGGELVINVKNCHFDETYESLAPEAKAGAYLSFTFSDSGVGIVPEFLAHVAKPFFTTKEPKQGFGFGLSDVQATLQGHQGFMVIKSEPKQGATVCIYIPVDAEITRELGAGRTLNPPEHGDGERILVVDDEIFVRGAIKKSLEDFGYHVLLAQDGKAALEMYETQASKVDLVITNIEMPVMDGSALCAALKKVNPNVKIIISSGHSESDCLRALQSHAVAKVLTKPYTADTLLQQVHSVLQD